VLADDTLAQRLLHLEQLLALAFHHPIDRNAGPAADDGGDVLARHFLAQQGVAGLALRLVELFLELGNAAVGQLARLGVVALSLRLVQLDTRGIKLLP
jgi:hypothetical protein